MRTFGWLAALAVSAATVAGSAAHAQAYYGGGYLPEPAYRVYGAPQAYEGGDEGCHDHLTLLGARAGVTVLGIDVDGHAGLRVGVNGACRRHHAEYAAPAYAPPAYPAQYAPQPAYPPMYPQPMNYGQPCGCAPQGPPMGYGQPYGY